MYHQFLELADVDITKQPMEVGPTMHYIMGGVRVEPDSGQSTVPGLFAAGEASGGMHGANRLGGNSLSDLVVFGRRAGLGAAQYARGLSALPGVNESEIEAEARDMLAPFDRSSGENPFAVQRDLQRVMGTYVGIFRIQADLEKALEELAAIENRLPQMRVEGTRMFNPGWHLSRDLRNMVLISRVIAMAALLRQESRGAHSRLDFPQLDPEFGKVNMAATLKNGTVNVAPSPLPPMPAELRSLFEEPAAAAAKA
jgi:succinate dehydrogenase / fumarate reductase flavoprotein subunit